MQAEKVKSGPARYLALDSLRGLLACMIVVYHMPTSGWIWTLSIVRNGFLAVTFFFVLSGFVIGTTYGERLGRGFSVPRFLGLRLGRIYPLHLFMILMLAGWAALRLAFGFGEVRGDPPFTGLTGLGALPYHIFLLQRFGPPGSHWNVPSWSIGVEWWTYIVFAVLAAALKYRGKLFSPAVLMIIPGAIATVTHAKLSEGWEATFHCLMSFGLGLLVCEFRRSAHVERITTRLSYASSTAIEIAVAALSLWMIAIFGGKLSPLIAPTFTVCIAVFSFEKGLVSRLLVMGPMLLLGELSYSIYMIHHFLEDRLLDLISLLSRHMALPFQTTETGRIVLAGNPLACDIFMVVTILIVVAASKLSYRYIETPARLWSRKMVNPKHDPNAKPRDPTAAF